MKDDRKPCSYPTCIATIDRRLVGIGPWYCSTHRPEGFALILRGIIEARIATAATSPIRKELESLLNEVDNLL